MESKAEPENAQAGLDQMEKRFSWFLNGPLKSVNENFQGIFPAHWNLSSVHGEHVLAIGECSF